MFGVAAENLPNSCEESRPQRVNKKYVWNQTHAENYRNSLNTKTDSFIALNDLLIQASSPRDIDQNIDMFAEIMKSVCEPLFGKHIRESNYTCNFETNSNNQLWLDEECRNLRNIFYCELNKYRRNKNHVNQKNVANARTNFKNYNVENTITATTGGFLSQPLIYRIKIQ